MIYVNCESFSIQRHVGLFTGNPRQKESVFSNIAFRRSSLSHYLTYEIFNLKLWFENNLHRLRMDFLSIGFCKQTNKLRMTTFFT